MVNSLPKSYVHAFVVAFIAELLENLDIEFDLVNFDFDYQLFNLLERLGEVIEIRGS